MSFQCLDPYVAVVRFTKPDGKKMLKLLSKNRLDYNINELKLKHGSDNVFVLPCGTCESCRRNRAEDWAIRCELEAKMHQYNYFITLTYDDFHIGKASVSDLKAFLDRLEGKGHKRKFKYFACQEYGELNQRLHFHLAIFCDFPIDLFNPKKVGSFYHYESNLMNDIWKYGFYTICPFETTCARYVAKYTAKNSKLYMSRNIGKSYFLAHYQEIIDDGFKVYSNFGGRYSAYVPQCFLRWYDEIDPLITKDHKDFKKSISKLVLCEKRRALVDGQEDSVIHNDQKRIIEKERIKHRL